MQKITEYGKEFLFSSRTFYESFLCCSLVIFCHAFNFRARHRSLLIKSWNLRPFPASAIQVIEVNTLDILHNQRFPFDVEGEHAIFGLMHGSWDSCIEGIDQKKLELSIAMRFRQGLPWSETPQYKKSLKAIAKGRETWNRCTSISDIHRRCDSIDKLYNDMNRNGFVSSLSPVQHRQIGGIEIPDLMTVAIDRKGNIIRCQGGRHRLAIAKIIGIESIPVVLLIKHEDCQIYHTPLRTINKVLPSDYASSSSA